MLEGNKRVKFFKTIIAVSIAVLHIIPFYILISVAFKPQTDLSSRWALPKSFYLENFIIAIERGRLLQAIINTAIITICSLLIVLVLSAMAAYPLARRKSKWNKIVLAFIVGVMMVPGLSILVPLYKLMSSIGGINTYWGIILIQATNSLPMSIYLYMNFISTIPKTLDEAALIDGCSRFSIFYRIILPLLKPVTASIVILTGISMWNNFTHQLYFLQKPSMRTVTLAISAFFTENASKLNAGAAAAIIAVLPPIILYLCMQKYFVQGVVDSGVK